MSCRAILEAIIAGESDPKKLVELYRVDSRPPQRPPRSFREQIENLTTIPG